VRRTRSQNSFVDLWSPFGRPTGQGNGYHIEVLVGTPRSSLQPPFEPSLTKGPAPSRQLADDPH
jgi:hypothetical protein